MEECQGRKLSQAWMGVAHQYQAAVSGHDLSIECPPQPHILNAWFSSSGAILEGSGNLEAGDFDGGSQSTEVGSLEGRLIPDPFPVSFSTSCLPPGRLCVTHSCCHDISFRQLRTKPSEPMSQDKSVFLS